MARFIEANGVRLAAEAFGDAGDPAILLIAGSDSAMDWWDTGLCERLAAGGRYVIRYDHRDTGASTAYPPGAPGYSGDDLAADAVALIDALAGGTAHVVGMSMGGMLAQRLAVRHPGRVATLTLVATSPDGPGTAALPPPEDAVRHGGPDLPDWSDHGAAVAYLTAVHEPYAGPVSDGARLRAIAARVADRTPDLAVFGNHEHADPGVTVRERLGAITAPTLVAHGTADPLFPYAHAEALAAEIPGARLLPLDGMGHETPPPALWDVFAPALLRHTSGGWPAQADRLARKAMGAGDPTGWFDVLYAEATADEVDMPWDRAEPQPLLAEWARQSRPTGRTALIVGCGLGADAEFVAGLGFATTAFDIAPTAVRAARDRHPGTSVRYVTADLLDPPPAWLRAYDLVVEVNTVQALPDPPRGAAIVNAGRLVAPGGTLVAIAFRDPAGTATRPPPFPLTRAEVAAYATDGLTEAAVDATDDHWRAVFTRPA